MSEIYVVVVVVVVVVFFCDSHELASQLANPFGHPLPVLVFPCESVWPELYKLSESSSVIFMVFS